MSAPHDRDTLTRDQSDTLVALARIEQQLLHGASRFVTMDERFASMDDHYRQCAEEKKVLEGRLARLEATMDQTLGAVKGLKAAVWSLVGIILLLGGTIGGALALGIVRLST